MYSFIIQFSKFTTFWLLTILVCLMLPPTPKASESLLFSKKLKDSLLIHTEAPRIIMIGGSNLNFGINSIMIRDSLKLNPINTGITAGLGLEFMLASTLKFVKTGDIIIIVPEYEHFYGTTSLGNSRLYRMVLDVDFREIRNLSYKQIWGLLKFVPGYSYSKLNPFSYFDYTVDEIYTVNSFNKYGDSYLHWSMNRRKFLPANKIDGQFNYELVEKLNQFSNSIKQRGAKIRISFPGIQETSFNRLYSKIKEVEYTLRKSGYRFLGSPERYVFPDSLMFNTKYHLTKEGVDVRTGLLIFDLRYDKDLGLSSH